MLGTAGDIFQGINFSGVVVGFSIKYPNETHVFLLTSGGNNFTTVDPPGSNGNPKGMAINDAGAFTGTLGSMGFVISPAVTLPRCIVAAP